MHLQIVHLHPGMPMHRHLHTVMSSDVCKARHHYVVQVRSAAFVRLLQFDVLRPMKIALDHCMDMLSAHTNGGYPHSDQDTLSDKKATDCVRQLVLWVIYDLGQ